MTHQPKNTEKIDFLVVAHTRPVRKQIVEMLEAGGHDAVRSVAGGRSARSILEENRVGFVIVEEDMPTMTGIEFLKLIRRKPECFDIPVLILFAQKHPQLIEYAREERADGFLFLPVQQQDLLKLTARIQEQKENVTALQQKLNESRKLQLEGEYDRSIKIAKEVLAESESLEALYTLSKCYFRKKNYDMSKKYLRKLLDRQPTSKTLHLLSKVCRVEDQCGDALMHLSRAAGRNPKNIDIRIDLGKVYLSMGMAEEAAKVFEAIVQGNPSDLSLIKIGKAYFKKGDLEMASHYLDLAQNPIPETIFIFKSLAEAFAGKGKLPQSIKLYEKCLKIVPDHPSLLLNIAKLYLQLDKLAEAKATLNYILKKHPNHNHTRNILRSLENLGHRQAE